jgi:hypothetical protein
MDDDGLAITDQRTQPLQPGHGRSPKPCSQTNELPVVQPSLACTRQSLPSARGSEAKKLMQLDSGQKDQVRAAGAEIHQDRRKVIPFNGIPPKAGSSYSSSTIELFAQDGRQSLPRDVEVNEQPRSGQEHPGDAYPSLPDAAVTRNPCMALQPVTRSGGNRPIRREQYAIGTMP